MAPHFSERIALLRPLLIFFVISVHTPGSQYRPDTQEGTAGIESFVNVLLSGTLGMVAVPTLSLIAGYLAINTLNRYGYPRFVARKARHLLLPMLLWNAIMAVIIAYAQYRGVNLRPDLTLYPVNLDHWLAGLTAIGKLPANAPLYFLRELFLACCLIPVWRFAARRPWLNLPILATLFWFSAVGISPVWLYRLDVYLFFAIGVTLAMRLPLPQLDTFIGAQRPGWVASLGTLCVLLALYASVTPATHFFSAAKVLMLFAPLLFWQLGGIIQQAPWLALFKRALLALSPATFTVFLGHIVVIQVLWHGFFSRHATSFYHEAYPLVWLMLIGSVYVSLYTLWRLTRAATTRGANRLIYHPETK